MIAQEDNETIEINKKIESALRLLAQLQESVKEEDLINEELRQQINMLALSKF